MSGFKAQEIRGHLSVISDVEHWLANQEKGRVKQQGKYWYICSALIVFAVTLFYIGSSKQLFSEVRYQYYSKGVILAGEAKDIFTGWHDLIHTFGGRKSADYKVKKAAMQQRSDREVYLTREHLYQLD